MSKLIICAAAVALAFATVPANAEHNVGPLRNGDQCWHNQTGPHGASGYGYWETCPSAIGAAHNAAGTGSELRRPLRPRRDPHNDR
jgi:hypothetical protein